MQWLMQWLSLSGMVQQLDNHPEVQFQGKFTIAVLGFQLHGEVVQSLLESFNKEILANRKMQICEHVHIVNVLTSCRINSHGGELSQNIPLVIYFCSACIQWHKMNHIFVFVKLPWSAVVSFMTLFVVPGLMGSRLSVRDDNDFPCTTVKEVFGLWVNEERLPLIHCVRNEITQVVISLHVYHVIYLSCKSLRSLSRF